MSPYHSPGNVQALEISDLSISYGSGDQTVHAVRNVSLSIAQGETYGLIGESGSGKTTIAYALLRYLQGGKIESGRVLIDNKNVMQMSDAELKAMRGNQVAMVYQDPMSSLNPGMRVGEQIAEALRRHLGLDRQQARRRVVELLGQVHLPKPEETARKYPHQLSGGQQQRVVIAMAISCEPDLLILDEPTTGLDVTTQAVILDLIGELRDRINTAIFFISHNLGVISETCDRIGVIYAGELVEEGRCEDVVSKPRHPYTVGLIQSIPTVAEYRRPLKSIPGSLPDLRDPPVGCIFASRCALAEESCHRQRPSPVAVADTHISRCLLTDRIPELELDTALVAANDSTDAGRPVVLELDEVKCWYPGRAIIPFIMRRPDFRAVDGVTLQLRRGQTLAVVGESGCGKSTLASSVVGLLPPTSGSIKFAGTKLASTAGARDISVQNRVQIIFQNSDGALNPQRTVGDLIARPIMLYNRAAGSKVKDRVIELLEAVSLNERYAGRYAHELSGGEKQRVNIARVMGADPEVVVCDEPTSALDISVQASIINKLLELQQSMNIAYLFISHDLAVVRYISDIIAVMYMGTIVDAGPTRNVFQPPHHPYTESLIAAVPDINNQSRSKVRLAGHVQLSEGTHAGCGFASRCPRKVGSICETQTPPQQPHGEGQILNCHIPVDELGGMQSKRDFSGG